MHYPRVTHSGVTTVLVLIFMGVFMLIMSALTGFAFEQAKYGRALYAREQALSVAEAGLEYYRWFLGHNTSIMTTGNGAVSPYTYTVKDPESGSAVGAATITANVVKQCGIPQWIDLTSKGVSSADPAYARTVSVRYMKPSVALYSGLYNTNLHIGPTSAVSGPIFSNGGIWMDGISSSTVSSALSTFYCDSSMGCTGVGGNPSAGWKAGVFGAGEDSTLWKYPVSSIDFIGMAANLSTLRGYAISNGLYLYDSTVSANHNTKGFHIYLNADGTVDVYRVNTTVAINSAYHVDDSDYHTDYDIIATNGQTLVGHYTIPSTCGVIYAEGTTWIQGTVKGKMTIVVADPSSGYDPDAILASNITYATTDGTSGLTVIAEHSIRIPLNSPDTMSVRGIYIAQSGYFGRDYYYSTPSGYSSYLNRTLLTVTGTVKSTQQPVLYWGSQGYANRAYSYDQVLAFAPPPFTPPVSSGYGYVLWQEK